LYFLVDFLHFSFNVQYIPIDRDRLEGAYHVHLEVVAFLVPFLEAPCLGVPCLVAFVLVASVLVAFLVPSCLEGACPYQVASVLVAPFLCLACLAVHPCLVASVLEDLPCLVERRVLAFRPYLVVHPCLAVHPSVQEAFLFLVELRPCLVGACLEAFHGQETRQGAFRQAYRVEHHVPLRGCTCLVAPPLAFHVLVASSYQERGHLHL